ncbi:MAG: hypothetical protein ACXAEX_11705 [Promethearchaeota archaeon]|jgi:hypothetical protein
MTMDFSNKRYSIIFAGILITFVASIIIVIALGIGGFNIHSSEEFDSNNDSFSIDMSKNSTPTIFNYEECFIEHRIVPGAELAFDLCHDVEAGWMEVTYNIPYEFPGRMVVTTPMILVVVIWYSTNQNPIWEA